MTAPSRSASERDLLVAALLCAVDVVLIGSASFASNSLTLLSDFLKESTDFISVLASYLTLRAVRKAPTEQFAFGIGKLENLVSFVMGILMMLCAMFILVQAAHHLQDPPAVSGTLPGILVFSVYAAIGGVFAWRHYRTLKVQHSAIVSSQFKLWLSKASFDALMAFTLTLVLLLPDQAWTRWLDPLASMVGAFTLMMAAWAMSSSSVGDLLDATLEEQLQMRILKVLVQHFDSYHQLHRIRTRRSGSRIYIEVFLGFDPAQTMGQAQLHMDTIRNDIAHAITGAEVVVVPLSAGNAG
jgi:ferrous-iron efflux pump FieF